MKKQVNDEVMTDLCMKVKKYVEEKDWDSCMELIPRYMERYPNSAVPHNLLGTVAGEPGGIIPMQCGISARHGRWTPTASAKASQEYRSAIPSMTARRTSSRPIRWMTACQRGSQPY
ncbi:MAG: hypothetical protein ACLTT1_06390 [[Clostridium] scindens]